MDSAGSATARVPGAGAGVPYEGPGRWTEKTVDISGVRGVGGAASSAHRNDKGEIVRTVRVTYSGPGVTRAEYDVIRGRVGVALGLDPSQVTVTPESASAAPGPQPKPS